MPKRGVQLSPEAKAKLSEQAKQRHAKRREEEASRLNQAAVDQVLEVPLAMISSSEEESSLSSERPVKQQSRAVQARYANERATDEELETLLHSLTLDKAFALYDRMKHNFEFAGRVLAARANQPEVQKCKTCGITWDEFIKTSRKPDWFLNRPFYMEGNRNVILVSHFCSASCVSFENNRTQGVRGIPDRGMLNSDNPKNHPHLNQKEV